MTPQDSAEYFGLTIRDINTIQQVFSKYPRIQTVRIFGSRSKGNYKPGSDIDLAIMDDQIEFEMLRKIRADFDDSSLPYRVDILHYPSLPHSALKEHIKRVGKTLPMQRTV